MKRYYVAFDSGLPLPEQPENGYTFMQAVKRIMRESENESERFNLPYNYVKKLYILLDSKTMKEVQFDENIL